MTASVRLLAGGDAPPCGTCCVPDPVSYAMVSERTQMTGIGSALGPRCGMVPRRTAQRRALPGSNVVPIAADLEAAHAFATRARLSPRRCSSIVGPAAAALAFFEQVERSGSGPTGPATPADAGHRHGTAGGLGSARAPRDHG